MLDKLTTVSSMPVCARGFFPKSWKIANLMLILKDSAGASQTVNARPICLLNDIRKIFEKIIIARYRRWLYDNLLAELSSVQYGFREGRLTCDALLRVVEYQGDYSGGIVIAISINAFNSLPCQ